MLSVRDPAEDELSQVLGDDGLGGLLFLRRGILDILDALHDGLDAPGDGRDVQQDQGRDGDDALNILDDVHDDSSSIISVIQRFLGVNIGIN